MAAEEKQLVNLIYASASNPPWSEENIFQILEVSLKKNKRLDVTGMLLYADGSYLQVLEGEKEVVENLFAVISRDSRHTNVVKIIEETIERRFFAEWYMGFTKMTRKELQEIPGCDEFFEQGKRLYEIEQSTARKVLEAFKEGRWRRTLT